MYNPISTVKILLQESLYRIYPNLFRLLWHSMLPCVPEDKSSDVAHILRQCSWQGKTVNCSDIFIPVVTDSGICCALNVRSSWKESNYSRLVTEMQGKERGKELLKAGPGIEGGLQVIIDQNSDR